MRWASVVRIATVVILVVGLADASRRRVAGAEDEAARPRAAMAAWDTGQPSDSALDVTSRSGWKPIPAQQTPASFQGDAVVTNGQALIVVRKHSPAAEVYAAVTSEAAPRVRLRLLTTDGDPVERLDRVALTENARAGLCLELAGQTAKGVAISAKVRLKRGDGSIQVEPGDNAGRLRVECPSRFVVLPDFFADDILIDARTLKPDRTELPSENFVLHLAGQGNALVMSVFENRQQDVSIALAGADEQRQVASSEIPFESKKVWIALLEGPRVWHTFDLKTDQAGKIVPLDWAMPFPGQWRIDFTRTDGLADSWEMLLPNTQGDGYLKPSWLGAGADHLNAKRERWNTVLGSYLYPCWSDHAGQSFVQPLRKHPISFQGPAVIYPINRVMQTPLDAYTIVDVMRNTLGVGPCEYILDLEGQRSEYKGRATCAVRDSLTPIYAARKQKERHDEVNRILDEGLTFVKHIRGRITRYVEFGHAMHAYLEEQKKAHPELADSLSTLDNLVKEIDAHVAARVDKIQTPEHVAAMNEKFRQEVLDNYGPNALALCTAYTKALVTIGDNQDELSGECRYQVRALRQRAGLLMTADPRIAPIAAEIRAKTQDVLRNPASHEGAHH